jgi:hypothetical protein
MQQMTCKNKTGPGQPDLQEGPTATWHNILVQ